MSNQVSSPVTIREGVALFDDAAHLDAAVSALEMAAFNRHEISVLGTAAEVRKQFGIEAVDPALLADHPEAPRSAIVMPEEKALGLAVLAGGGAYAGVVSALLIAGLSGLGNEPLTMTVLAIAGGCVGGLLGGGVAKLLHDKFRKDKLKQVDKGGLVLWVRIFEPERWKIARRIMRRHGGHAVRLHEIRA